MTNRVLDQSSLLKHATLSLRLGAHGTEFAIGEDVIRLKDIRLGWWRKRFKPEPPDYIAADDRELARSEAFIALDSVRSLLALESRCINRFVTEDSFPKVHQLFNARAVGFKIPATYIGSDPSAVRSMLAERGELVVKGFRPFSWSDPGKAPIHYMAATLRRDDEFSDQAIKGCPCIYQERIRNGIELRATVFCNQILCAAIAYPAGYEPLDWRRYRKITVTPYRLSEDHDRLVRAFMNASGLDTACLDMIIDDIGCLYFLEANPAGQFLWVENDNPDIPVLRTATQFIADRMYGEGAPRVPADINMVEFRKSDAHGELVARIRKATADR